MVALSGLWRCWRDGHVRAARDQGPHRAFSASVKPEVTMDPDDYDDNPTPICPATGTYCSGQFCDDYGCAKQAGFWDDEDD